MNILIKFNGFKNLIFYFGVAIFFTIVISNEYKDNSFIGDPMDGRLIILLHEHWYQFVVGKENFFETNFFYPEKNTFGYSDIYLFSGLIYVIFRILNFNEINSIQYTYLSIFCISTIIMIIFSKKFFRSSFSRYFFVLFCFTSQIYLFNITSQVNTLFYYLLFILPILYSIYNNSSNIKIKNFTLYFFCITPLIIGLTIWYMFFFLLYFSIIFFVISLITKKHKIIFDFFYNILNYLAQQKFLFFSISLSNLVLTLLFLRIYWPNRNNLIKVDADLLNSSPNPLELFFYSPWYDLKNNFSGLFLLIIILLCFFVTYVKTKSKNNFLISNLLIANSLSVIILLKFFDLSLFYYLWKVIPVFESIRYPSRFLIMNSVIFVYIFLISLENILNKNYSKNFFYLVLNFFLLMQIIFNLEKIKIFQWEKSDYISTIYDSQLHDLDDCNTVIVDGEKRSIWMDNLEAMTIAAKTQKKTLNGYSGTLPLGYPLPGWYQDSNFFSLVNWANDKTNLNGLCLLNQRGAQPIDFPVAAVLTNDFDVIEKNSKAYWSWSLKSNSQIMLFNFSNKDIESSLRFKARLPDCNRQTEKEIEFYDDLENRIHSDVITKKLRDYRVNIKIKSKSESSILVNIEDLPCANTSDPRKVFFLIYDMKVIS